jgi:hypothetical protein
MDVTVCPECAEPAAVQWRAVLESTDGPIEHAKIRCDRGHWFLLPVASLARSERAVSVQASSEWRRPAGAGAHHSAPSAAQ